MFVLTKEKSVRLRDVIGVFDLDTATVSGISKNFLSNAEKNGEVEGTDSLPKSFIFVNYVGTSCTRSQSKVYLSSRLAGYINK